MGFSHHNCGATQGRTSSAEEEHRWQSLEDLAAT